jgi:multidrug efflux pump subunit AcrB
MRSLIQFFYKQHLLGNMITLLILVVGVYSAFSIRKDLFPKVEFDVTLVVAILPGASPEQVEKLLVNPIEQALREVDGIKKVTSNATESRAVITVQLDPDGRNTDKTNTDIQRAMDRIENYPEEAERPVVRALESGQTPVIELTISAEQGDELAIREAAKRIADDLAFVPGVAAVQKNAWRKKEIQVLVDGDKLAARQLALGSVINAFRTQNLQLPAGDLVLPNGREKSVKTDAEIRTAAQAKEVVIQANISGYGVAVKDIATVRDGLEKPTLHYRSNGQRALTFTIIKKEKADALDVVASVRAKMEQLAPSLPQGVRYEFVNDFTEYLNNRISILSGNLLMGIVLVFGVLALFLPFRVAVVVAIGIPFSMLAAIITIGWLGFSINLISLIGLIIVAGMLVDDAIVVVENIYRRLERGDPLEMAIVEGTAEMVAPVTASVLTTVAAFSPMMFMTGVFGKFVFDIPVMVILPLLYSLFEAIAIAPGHVFTFVGDQYRKDLQEQKKVHWYDRLLPKYRQLISWTVDNKWKTSGVFCLLFAISLGMATQMKFILFPPEGVYSFFIRLDGEPGASLEEMEALVKQVEPHVAALPKNELRAFVATVGLQQNEPNDPLTKRASHYAQIRVNLTPESERDRNVSDVVEELRAKIIKPAGATKLGFEIARGGPPQGRPISVNIYGEDFVILRQLANQVKAELKTIDGVVDIEDSEVVGKREIRVAPDAKKVAAVGLTMPEVAQTVRAAFAGVVATSSISLDEEIDIRVEALEQGREATAQLKDVKVGNNRGHQIALSQIASFEESDSRLLVQHEKFKRILNVSAQVDLEKTTAIVATKQLEQKLKGLLQSQPGYSINFGGENEDTAESMKSLGRAFFVAALLIFTILVITFNSFIQPFMVLLAIPMGFMGVVWALTLHGRPLSFMAMLGVIALAGVIVNNAIVMMDFYNSRKREGADIREALIDAAVVRLRPIILTSVTTVLGLFPTAYGIGGSDGFVKALCLALGWGLAIGSFFTVLLFPALLMIVETATASVNRWLERTWFRKLLFVAKGK